MQQLLNKSTLNCWPLPNYVLSDNVLSTETTQQIAKNSPSIAAVQLTAKDLKLLHCTEGYFEEAVPTDFSYIADPHRNHAV